MLTDSHADNVCGERDIKVVSIGAGQAGNLKIKHSERTYVLSERTDAYPLTKLAII